MKNRMNNISECSIQIKKAIGDAMEVLSEEKQKQLILNVCTLIKEQRSEAVQQISGLSEELAISTCSINDESLAEQEKILEEIITKHSIEAMNSHHVKTHRR